MVLSTAALPQVGRTVRLLLLSLVVGLLGAVNLFLAGKSIGLILSGAPAVDWEQYVEASRRLAAHGDLYAVTDTYAYHYSPLLAAFFGLLAPLGTFGWRALHLVAAVALPSWPLRALALVSWPFWYDVETGNVMIFVVLAGAWALAGSRLGAGSFLLLGILIPRPLMLPLVAWMLWRQPEWRLPAAAALAAHTVAVMALGWGAEWLAALLAAGGDVTIPSNVGPSRFIGTVPWVLIGVPVAVFLTLKGRVGFASLAASPYWLPYYLLMPLLELVRRPAPARLGDADR